MSRISLLDPAKAEPKAREMLDAVKAKLGRVPNVFKVMAHSPATFASYLSFSGALKEGKLDPKLGESIALAVAERNHCGYCLAAHCAIGKMAGLTPEEIGKNRRGTSADPKNQAALEFAGKVVAAAGKVVTADVEAVKKAGFSEGEVVEIVANVALNLFTNYVNHVAETDIDFPKP